MVSNLTDAVESKKYLSISMQNSSVEIALKKTEVMKKKASGVWGEVVLNY